MRPNRLLTLTLSPLALLVVLLAAYFLVAEQRAEAQSAQPQREPTAAEISKKETVASAFLRGLQYQEYEVPSAAEAMPEEKYGYRPAEGKFKNERPEFGPAEVRTFGEQVKHVACANFGFAAELDGTKPPEACDKGGPSPAKTKKELLTYLRDSFAAARKSLGAIDAKNMFEPIEGPILVLWWIPAGHVPTVVEAQERLHLLKERGPSPAAFTFRTPFPAPDPDGQIGDVPKLQDTY